MQRRTIGNGEKENINGIFSSIIDNDNVVDETIQQVSITLSSEWETREKIEEEKKTETRNPHRHYCCRLCFRACDVENCKHRRKSEAAKSSTTNEVSFFVLLPFVYFYLLQHQSLLQKPLS